VAAICKGSSLNVIRPAVIMKKYNKFYHSALEMKRSY